MWVFCGYSWCPVLILISHISSRKPFDPTRLAAITTASFCTFDSGSQHIAVCQNLVPLVNIKIAGKWMFIPLKMVLIGIDPYPYVFMRRHQEVYKLCIGSVGWI